MLSQCASSIHQDVGQMDISACVMKLDGEEGFLFGGALVWKRETYKKKGCYVTGQERKEKI